MTLSDNQGVHSIVTRALRSTRGGTKPKTFLLLVLSACSLHAAVSVKPVPVPGEMRSSYFTVTVNGKPVDVAHAAANYYFFSFDLSGKARVEITAPTEDYWERGVEVQPWRLGIRPKRKGRVIGFTLNAPTKLSITRPGDHLGGAEMIFLFANSPETNVPDPRTAGIRYYGPGEHHENIDARSGDTIYLAPGAVVYGALNIWDVENVHIFGRGTIVYEGNQNPIHDEGWMHKKNWHVIVMHNARHITVEGITCVVRSRTWMIQMRDSHDIRFENVKLIGGSPGNANQDGMDWLGGGDTVVKDVFIRAADDIFAAYGNWEGYGDDVITLPGHEVSNIKIEDSVLSTSISNVVRISWPRKVFDSHNFVMRNSDVIHMGMGGCLAPFALLEVWDTPGGEGEHSGYTFDNIRLENWYSLVQLRHANPSIHNVRLQDIWALESPSLFPSTFDGVVKDVQLANISLGGKIAAHSSDIPLELKNGAEQPVFENGQGPVAVIAYQPTAVRPGKKVIFKAKPTSKEEIISYEWLFGDGTRATGETVHHKFPDTLGTLLDGSGRFRVLLKTTNAQGRTAWSYSPVVVSNTLQAAATTKAIGSGLSYLYYEAPSGTLALQHLKSATVQARDLSATITSSVRKRETSYALVFDGYIAVPADGGYTFTLFSNDEGTVQIDGRPIASSPKPWPLVCGTPGNSVQSATGSIGLRAGRHAIHVEMTHNLGSDDFSLWWQAPNGEISPIPASALSH